MTDLDMETVASDPSAMAYIILTLDSLSVSVSGLKVNIGELLGHQQATITRMRDEWASDLIERGNTRRELERRIAALSAQGCSNCSWTPQTEGDAQAEFVWWKCPSCGYQNTRIDRAVDK